ncbi:hypothetical protein M408DRAFT_75455 [Serendipita vermifera MAFF 305830]|uniref:C2H2-type domain-containing protein n=1 Tax=Serendipita vermifera MAFF 305830 TaxID=933852 RepID=A0A0C3AZM5_SERVB|nr:hypothetical protein M408DRAFT_75455 [Serendipita vermifera MAFF 305830]
MSSPSPSQASDNGPQTCGLCGATLGNSSHLARHKASVHGQTYYPCTVSGCDFATSRQDSLNNHLRAHGISPDKGARFVSYTPR